MTVVLISVETRPLESDVMAVRTAVLFNDGGGLDVEERDEVNVVVSEVLDDKAFVELGSSTFD